MESEPKYTLDDLERWIHNFGVDVSVTVKRSTDALFALAGRVEEHARRTAEQFDRIQEMLKKIG